MYHYYISEDWTSSSPERPLSIPAEVQLPMKMNVWSIFCCTVCGNGPPFNIWSAGMNSLIKAHLEIDFYGLLSIAVSILCCLIFELHGAILLIFDCSPRHIPLSWRFILHISYCLLRIFLFYSLHVDGLITLYVLLFSSSGMNLNSITICKSEITLLRFMPHHLSCSWQPYLSIIYSMRQMIGSLVTRYNLI